MHINKGTVTVLCSAEVHVVLFMDIVHVGGTVTLGWVQIYPCLEHVKLGRDTRLQLYAANHVPANVPFKLSNEQQNSCKWPYDLGNEANVTFVLSQSGPDNAPQACATSKFRS